MTVARPHLSRCRNHIASHTIADAIRMIGMYCKFPNMNRKYRQNRLAGSCHATGTGKRDRSIVVIFIYNIFSSKSLSYLHMFQYPVIRTVQVQNSGQGLNVLNILNLKIHVVNRTDWQLIKCGISRNKLYTRLILCAVNHDLTSNASIISCIVGNLDTDSVDSIGQLKIINTDRSVRCTSNSRGQKYTVHIHLNRRSVQPGVVALRCILCHFSHNSYGVSIDSLSVHLLVGISVFQNTYMLKLRSFAIFYHRRIVYGNIIKINCKLCLYIGEILIYG